MTGPTFLAFVRMKLGGVEGPGSEDGEGSEVDGGPDSSSDGSQGHDFVQEGIIFLIRIMLRD